MTIVRFASTDVEETTRVLSSFYELGIEPTRRSAFSIDTTTANVGPLRIGRTVFGCAVSVAVVNPEDSYGIVLTRHGSHHITSGRDEFVRDAHTAHVMCPGQPATSRGWQAGDRHSIGINVNSAVLRAHLSALTGRDITRPVLIDPACDVRDGAGLQWRSLVHMAESALDDETSWLFNPIAGAQLASALMTGLLYTSIHRYRDVLHDLASRPAHPYVVRRALQIIDDRAHEPLTIAGIAREVGCNVRTLQAGFQRHVDMTPGQRLRQVRMARIHSELSAGNQGTASVSQVARRWGMEPSGHFSAQYRSMYGVSPSQTLRA